MATLFHNQNSTRPFKGSVSKIGSKVGQCFLLCFFVCFGMTGCHLIIPDISHQPQVHNPFPQLQKVAIVPFFNQSEEPTVDGMQFATAYYSELQKVIGFEVVPPTVVEQAMVQHRLGFSNPETVLLQIRKLAEILQVDAVVIGSITDFNPYYPPRCGLRVEWYAANPGFHEIPVGYGLPWGTPEEEFIPDRLVLEAELAKTRAALKAQTPLCKIASESEPKAAAKKVEVDLIPLPVEPSSVIKTQEAEGDKRTAAEINQVVYREGRMSGPRTIGAAGVTDFNATDGTSVITRSETGCEAGCLVGAETMSRNMGRVVCNPNEGPVITHTRLFQGDDADFTEALQTYVNFKNDERFGGWQTYLERTDDFIRFCCHLHISEMLSARGGATETRVMWRWSDSR